MNDWQLLRRLSATDSDALRQTHDSVAEALLHPSQRFPNVAGLGIGIKWQGGQPTGRPALLFLVTQKVSAALLSPSARLPAALAGWPTDVLAIGRPSAQPGQSAGGRFTACIRPACGGYSIGHPCVTAGTIGACLQDTCSLESGRPAKAYILSNNHILAWQNKAHLNDPIFQPGILDSYGRLCPIGRLSKFVPMDFFPPLPLHLHNNLVDAAIAQSPLGQLDTRFPWLGDIRGVLPAKRLTAGLPVMKVGRTTGLTCGHILAVHATVDVSYAGGSTARLRQQLLSTSMTAGGDSGSLLVTPQADGLWAVGLHCASSGHASIASRIDHVLRLLRVSFAGGQQAESFSEPYGLEPHTI